ncbi:hypothetical protein VF14_34570 [Nostoc linckia z18]|jgi:hypothetical protein|uniref:Uncharacterized protein n=2 Tax=Nostoc linckia TaxID=92942 RepID=A0A9Q5ZA76_NOSLI|nr:hypothetical protein [Nostoc linckia]PHK30154.1 hypothetical protein VF12_29995 [Nostoc linckia z15]PHK39561.1 hypothetical protein VF13_34235 [Nostoc linckia z16]PHJ56906.1 hypothetical protein VF03_37120 [Nostoc linckia z2]PHJ57885.1 hypothetical protein VF02_29300 [Nostoc linckia z1]PHJ60534.1 hypothetical protein VF05_30510 [Nostoc linckia z3]
MTKLSHPRRTRILPPSPIALSEKSRHQEKQNALAMQCRVVFDRLYPQLIDTHYNWYIAIDPESENYLIDPTLKGITQKICDAYPNPNEVKITIFRLNDTGTCGRLWV